MPNARGRYQASPPTLTEGTGADLLLDSAGKLMVNAGGTAEAALADGTANPTTSISGALVEWFNGTTWDRARSGLSTAQSAATGMGNVLPTGIYNSSAPTLTNGQFVALQLDVNGRLLVSTGSGSAAALADATANPTTTTTASDNMFFNGTTWDRGRSGVVTAGTATTGWQNVIQTGIYSTSKPTLTNGQYSVPQCNVNGAQDINEVLAAVAEDNTNGVIALALKPLAASTYCRTVYYIDSPANAKANIKASAGVVYGFHAYNANVAGRWLQLSNETGTTITPVVQFWIAALTSVVIGEEIFGPNGMYFSTGISYGFSTTQGSFVAGTAGNHTLTLTYT